MSCSENCQVPYSEKVHADRDIMTSEYPNLHEFLERNIAENKGIGLFKESIENREMLLIGYFGRYLSMAEVSKKLPKKALSILREKLRRTDIQIIDTYIKKCRFSGKKMTFVALVSKNMQEVEEIFAN
jgi:hypothetical protein